MRNYSPLDRPHAVREAALTESTAARAAQSESGIGVMRFLPGRFTQFRLAIPQTEIADTAVALLD